MSANREDEAKRTAFLLAAAQAIVGSAAPISISLGALAGHHLLADDKSLATVPVTGFTIGVALGAVPAAMLIRRLGQRAGFMSGTGVTASGGLIAALGLYLGDFWIFTLGLLAIGIGNGFVQQFRFAAADNAPPQFKARAISFVLAGGVVTAILGPQIVIFTRNLLAPIEYAGAFVSVLVLAAVGAAILAFLPARQVGGSLAADPAAPRRPLATILAQPVFAVGLLCGVGSYALMSFVMTGAPLAMVGHGHTHEDAALGISWHVMAMYAPSFFTGRLIARFGTVRIVAAGFLLLVTSAAVGLSGTGLWEFWISLILLGLGWNFGFIGATAMVTQSYRASEKSGVQGLHDVVLFGTVAFASFMSGLAYNASGWDLLNWVILPVSAVCLASLALLARAKGTNQ